MEEHVVDESIDLVEQLLFRASPHPIEHCRNWPVRGGGGWIEIGCIMLAVRMGYDGWKWRWLGRVYVWICWDTRECIWTCSFLGVMQQECSIFLNETEDISCCSSDSCNKRWLIVTIVGIRIWLRNSLRVNWEMLRQRGSWLRLLLQDLPSRVSFMCSTTRRPWRGSGGIVELWRWRDPQRGIDDGFECIGRWGIE